MVTVVLGAGEPTQSDGPRYPGGQRQNRGPRRRRPTFRSSRRMPITTLADLGHRLSGDGDGDGDADADADGLFTKECGLDPHPLPLRCLVGSTSR